MSEYKRDLMVATAMGVLLVALISGVIYYLFPPTLVGSQPRVAFSFFLGPVIGASAGSIGKNETVYLEMLEIRFEFSNGTIINIPKEPDNLRAEDLSDFYPDKYSGEVIASSLQRITVQVRSTYGAAADMDYTVDTVRNSTICASLKGVKVVDLGVFERRMLEKYVGYSKNSSVVIYPHEVDISSSGNWTREHLNPELGIDIAELSGMLSGSGVTLIAFDAAHSVSLKYNITSGGTAQGEADLRWEGRMGTFEFVHHQGRITLVRYDFTTIKLSLLTI